MSREKTENRDWTPIEIVLMSIVAFIFFLNILFPFFIQIVPIWEELVLIGWGLLGLGLLFVILSIVTLRRKGTSGVIDTGIYSLLRHPMYGGGIILFLSHPFCIQHWFIVTSSLIGIICIYVIIHIGDQRNCEKFGEEYKRYMQVVPQINFFRGIIRRLQR